MTNSGPLVTVIAMCFNHSRFAVQCLDSIRNQTYKNIQLIIMDDCSRDDSVAVIRDWIVSYDVDCVFVQHYRNVGICKTLNEAISHAKGKYVSMISTDDVWSLDKIERQVAQMEKLPGDVGVLYSDAYQIDERGNVAKRMFIESRRSFESIPEGYIFPTLIEGNFIPAMTTLIRKSCYDKVGLYDERLCYEDYDMWLRMSRYYEFVFSPFVSAKYRILTTSLIHTVLKADKVERFLSNFIIYSKAMRLRDLSPRQKNLLRSCLMENAISLYRLKYYDWKIYLPCAVRYDMRIRTLIMAVFSACRIPYPVFLKYESFEKKYRSYLVWRFSAGSKLKELFHCRFKK